MKYQVLHFLMLAIFINIYVKDIDDNQITLKKGNFALASSQQPGPLFSFGQNIIDKNDLQLYLYSDYIKSKSGSLTNIKNSNVMPGLLYGIRNDLAIFFNIPISIILNSNLKSTQAGGSVQIEYAYFTKSKLKSAYQATILAAISGPNGSMIKQISSNRNSSTMFLGGTFNYMSLEWYLFSSLGELFSIKNKSKTKLGDNFLYQAGIGKNLYHSSNYIYLFLAEVLGSKFKPNFTNGKLDSNSGGNIIFIAPSIWISSEKTILQLGCAIPIYQSLNGSQRYSYQIAVDLGWKF